MVTKGIDGLAFRSLTYGMYIVSAKSGEVQAGCIVNTFQQVTSTPARVSVAINKDNRTAQVVSESGRFEASVLSEDAPMELIGRFGFHTSTELDKFADTAHETDSAGTPYVTEHAIAHFGVRVIEAVDAGTHYVFIGEVEFAETLSDDAPMTYAYYHTVKGGKTPPKASSYNPEADLAKAESEPAPSGKPRIGWRCMLCGYIVEADELPEDFTCPMCGATRDMFERIEL